MAGSGSIQGRQSCPQLVLQDRDEQQTTEKDKDSLGGITELTRMLRENLKVDSGDKPKAGPWTVEASARSMYPFVRNSPGIPQRGFPKLPSLLRTLEPPGRGSDGKGAPPSLVGSSNLAQVAQSLAEVQSPNTAKTPARGHSFETAKRQVDTDLRQFKNDAEALLVELKDCDAWRESAAAREVESQQINRLIDSAEECLESHPEDFRNSVTNMVDELEEHRSYVDNRRIKALYTKLLLVLTRCSRMLVTEQHNMFATEPRQQGRYPMGLSFSVKGNAGMGKLLAPPQEHSAIDEAVLRCHTMPVKQLAAMAKQLQLQASQGSMSLRSQDTDSTSHDRPTRPSKLSISSFKSKIGSEVSFKLLSNGGLLPARAASGSGTGAYPSERPSPAELDSRFASVQGDEYDLMGVHGDGTSAGAAGTGKKPKTKSILKRITHKLQKTFGSKKHQPHDSDESNGSKHPSRSSSFLGAAMSFLRTGGTSYTISPASAGAAGHAASAKSDSKAGDIGLKAGAGSVIIAGTKSGPLQAASGQSVSVLRTSSGSMTPSATTPVDSSSGMQASILRRGALPRKDKDSASLAAELGDGLKTPGVSFSLDAGDERSSVRPTRGRTTANRVRFALTPDEEKTSPVTPDLRTHGASFQRELSHSKRARLRLEPSLAEEDAAAEGDGTTPRREEAGAKDLVTTSSGATIEFRPHPMNMDDDHDLHSPSRNPEIPYLTPPVKGIDPHSHDRPSQTRTGVKQVDVEDCPSVTGQPPAGWMLHGYDPHEDTVFKQSMEAIKPSLEAIRRSVEDGARFSAGSGSPAATDRPSGSEYMATPDRVSPEDVVVVCSVCEEEWPTYRLEEHTGLCAVLQQVVCPQLSLQNLPVDFMLTTLANVLEEQLEVGELKWLLRPELMKVVHMARNAAALQPDGSKIPFTRCLDIQQQFQDMSDFKGSGRDFNTITVTYARKLLHLVEQKLSLLMEPLQKRRALGSTGEADSGTSTPHSGNQQAPGMSIDEFEIIKPISRGAFGRVYLARKHTTGDLFAIKVMKKRDLIRKNMVESVNNERNILAMANNPFVVRFYYSFTSKENLYLVMEYLNGGDCYSLLRKFGSLDEDIARMYIAETVLALEYCHTQGIIHRDMKPDNMLISAQGHVKLTDFGLSCIGVIDRTDNLGALGSTDGMDAIDANVWSIREDDYERDSYMESAMDQDSHASPMSTAPNSYGDRLSPQDKGSLAYQTSDMILDSPIHQSLIEARSSAPSQLNMNGRNMEAEYRHSLPGSSNSNSASTSNSNNQAHRLARNATSLNERTSSNLNPARTSASSVPSVPNTHMLVSRDSIQPHRRTLTRGFMSVDRHTTSSLAAAAVAASAAAAGYPAPNLTISAPTPSAVTPNMSLQNTPTMGRIMAPEGDAKRAVGTPDYLAPELLLGTGHGPEVDWWALGAILYEMVCGIPPFNASTPEEIFDNILDRNITWPDDEDDMSSECRDLIDKLLQPNPGKRLGHRGAGEIKLHPWFKGVDWTDLARSKAAFVPQLEDEEDTSYFEPKHVSAKSMAEDLSSLRQHTPVPRCSDSSTLPMTSNDGSTAHAAGHQQGASCAGRALDPAICIRLQQEESLQRSNSGRSSSPGSRSSAPAPNSACTSQDGSLLSIRINGCQRSSNPETRRNTSSPMVGAEATLNPFKSRPSVCQIAVSTPTESSAQHPNVALSTGEMSADNLDVTMRDAASVSSSGTSSRHMSGSGVAWHQGTGGPGSPFAVRNSPGLQGPERPSGGSTRSRLDQVTTGSITSASQHTFPLPSVHSGGQYQAQDLAAQATLPEQVPITVRSSSSTSNHAVMPTLSVNVHSGLTTTVSGTMQRGAGSSAGLKSMCSSPLMPGSPRGLLHAPGSPSQLNSLEGNAIFGGRTSGQSSPANSQGDSPRRLSMLGPAGSEREVPRSPLAGRVLRGNTTAGHSGSMSHISDGGISLISHQSLPGVALDQASRSGANTPVNSLLSRDQRRTSLSISMAESPLSQSARGSGAGGLMGRGLSAAGGGVAPAVHHDSDGSSKDGSGSNTDSTMQDGEQLSDSDPFTNFSYTNYTTLQQANYEKATRVLRAHTANALQASNSPDQNNSPSQSTCTTMTNLGIVMQPPKRISNSGQLPMVGAYLQPGFEPAMSMPLPAILSTPAAVPSRLQIASHSGVDPIAPVVGPPSLAANLAAGPPFSPTNVIPRRPPSRAVSRGALGGFHRSQSNLEGGEPGRGPSSAPGAGFERRSASGSQVLFQTQHLSADPQTGPRSACQLNLDMSVIQGRVSPPMPMDGVQYQLEGTTCQGISTGPAGSQRTSLCGHANVMDAAADRQFTRDALPILTAQLLNQQVSMALTRDATLTRQQSSMSHSSLNSLGQGALPAQPSLRRQGFNTAAIANGLEYASSPTAAMYSMGPISTPNAFSAMNDNADVMAHYKLGPPSPADQGSGANSPAHNISVFATTTTTSMSGNMAGNAAAPAANSLQSSHPHLYQPSPLNSASGVQALTHQTSSPGIAYSGNRRPSVQAALPRRGSMSQLGQLKGQLSVQGKSSHNGATSMPRTASNAPGANQVHGMSIAGHSPTLLPDPPAFVDVVHSQGSQSMDTVALHDHGHG